MMMPSSSLLPLTLLLFALLVLLLLARIDVAHADILEQAEKEGRPLRVDEKIDQIEEAMQRFDEVKELLKSNPEVLKKWYTLPLEQQMKIVKLAEERANTRVKTFVEGFEELEKMRQDGLKAEQRAREELKERQEKRRREEEEHERKLREEYERRELEERTVNAAKLYWLGLFSLSFAATRIAFQMLYRHAEIEERV